MASVWFKLRLSYLKPRLSLPSPVVSSSEFESAKQLQISIENRVNLKVRSSYKLVSRTE